MTKISNYEDLDGSTKYKISRRSKIGIILSIVSVGALFSGLLSSKHKEDFPMPITKDVSINDINDMNIIINDNSCSDAFFNDVCDILKKDGLLFDTTNECTDINKDGSTVVTLDQQYSSGSGTLIFAPYSNTRLGDSDSLAISMKSAFDQNGFFVDNIMCSQIGFEQDDSGNVKYNVATDTEKAIDDDKDTSFVTISFGTNNINAEWVAKSIENGLARQKCYLSNYNDDTDLIYCASASDSIDDVAKYFSTGSATLVNFNNINNNTFNDGQAIVNPGVDKMDIFNKNVIFEIDNVKTRAY